VESNSAHVLSSGLLCIRGCANQGHGLAAAALTIRSFLAAEQEIIAADPVPWPTDDSPDNGLSQVRWPGSSVLVRQRFATTRKKAMAKQTVRLAPSRGGFANIAAGLTLVVFLVSVGLTASSASPVAVPPAHNWSVQHLYAPVVGGIQSVSCPSASDCWLAGGTGVLASRTGGATWSAQPLPTGVDSATSIACPSSASCFATAGRIVVASGNGGRT
jgi:hypothetical protein